jgi:hypothetical protein
MEYTAISGMCYISWLPRGRWIEVPKSDVILRKNDESFQIAEAG